MPEIPVTNQSDLAGQQPPFQACAVGDYFYNDGRTVLWFWNQAGAVRFPTVDAGSRCNHGFLDAQPTEVGNGMVEQSLRFPVSRFNDGVFAYLSYPEGVAGLSVAAVRMEDHEG